MTPIDCINSQCGASAGDCGCAARVREAAAFLDRHASKLDGFTRWDDEDDRHIEAAAAECREMAARLRGGGEA